MIGGRHRKSADELVIPDLIEPIIGWRAWHLLPSRRLGSLVMHYTWQPRESEPACCLKDLGYFLLGRGHKAPAPRCQCGYYALREVDELLRQLDELLRQQPTCALIGTVSLWGRVIPAKRGWRGQFAYPKQLFLFEERCPQALGAPETIAEELRQAYGVPCRLLQGLKREPSELATLVQAQAA